MCTGSNNVYYKMALCCLTKFLILKELWKACSLDQCGLQCHAIGRRATNNTGCVICQEPLQECNATNTAESEAFVNFTSIAQEPRPNCIGRSCLFCSNVTVTSATVSQLPVSGVWFVSKQCTHFSDIGPTSIVTVPIPHGQVMDGDLTIYVASNVTLKLTGGALVVAGALVIQGGGQIQMAPEKALNAVSECAIVVTTRRRTEAAIRVFIQAHVFVITNYTCGLGVFPTTGARMLRGNIMFTNITSTTGTQFYAAAIANVNGTLRRYEKTNKAIILNTNSGKTRPNDPLNIIDLTAMLGTFGRHLEITYAAQAGAVQHLTWLPAANRGLAIALAVICILWASNPGSAQPSTPGLAQPVG